ncbi:VanZ family protein [Streptomyces sp. NPDC058045]|uniref:VanZ family protein n=1 Tax=Streptomyces sp. NPDC058045 TaxID=3346311 RepID=UPI0036E47C01
MQRQGPYADSSDPRLRAAGGILLTAHLLLVAWLALRPLDVPWVSPPNVHPFAGIRADLALGPWHAVLRLGSALLLLAPLGALLPLAGGRLVVSPLVSLTRTVAATALISLGIELLQTGVPGRVADVDAVLLNSLGAALVHLLVVPAARARLRRRATGAGRRAAGRTEAGQGSTPTIPRVGIAPWSDASPLSRP